MTRMTGFVFQDEYLDRVQGLTDEQLGKLVRALSAYHAAGEAPKLEPEFPDHITMHPLAEPLPTKV